LCARGMCSAKNRANAGCFFKIRECALEIASAEHHMVNVNREVCVFRPRQGDQSDRDDKDDCSLREVG
jgi:hypothetical protein